MGNGIPTTGITKTVNHDTGGASGSITVVNNGSGGLSSSGTENLGKDRVDSILAVFGRV